MMSLAIAKQDISSVQLASVLDMNGKINVRLGLNQIQPFIRIYHREKERLDWFRERYPDFSKPSIVSRNTFMTQLISIEGIHSVLDTSLPYIEYIYPIAQKTFDYCESRLSHPNQPYTPHELKLVKSIINMSTQDSKILNRLRRLENYELSDYR